MADPIDRDDIRRRPVAEDDERRVAETPEIANGPASAPGDEDTAGAKEVVGLQMGMFLPAVILGVIFLIAIIFFAVTR